MYDDGSKLFLYFSDLLNRPISDPEGRVRGRLTDLKVRLGEPFPKVDSLVIRRRGEKSARVLDWSSVETIRDRSAVLKPGAESRLTGLEVGNEEILLREDLLDKQVVDTHGSKIERVNDVHLLIAHGELRIVHVDFGLRGILRRLGWMRTIDAVTDWLFSYRIAEKLVSWKCVQPLASDLKKNLKLNVTVRKLHELHPSDIADIIEELDRANRSSVFRALDTETAAETLQEVDPKLQLSLIETAPPDRASDILETMEPDEAREFLADLPEEKMEQPHRHDGAAVPRSCQGSPEAQGRDRGEHHDHRFPRPARGPDDRRRCRIVPQRVPSSGNGRLYLRNGGRPAAGRGYHPPPSPSPRPGGEDWGRS